MIELLFPPCSIPAISDEAGVCDPTEFAALFTAPVCPLVPMIPVPGPEPAVVDGRFCPVSPKSSECEAVGSETVISLVGTPFIAQCLVAYYRSRCSTF